MATHSTILAWEISWVEEPGGLQYMGRRESDTTQRTTNPKALVEEQAENEMANSGVVK